MQNAGQAEQRRVNIEGWQWISPSDHLIDTRAGAGQVHQFRLHFQQHRSPAAFDEFRIADELQRVAKSLFGMQENLPAGQRLSVPKWLQKVSLENLLRSPPPLVSSQPPHKIAQQEFLRRQAAVSRGKLRIASNRIQKTGLRLGKLAQIMVGHAKAMMGVGNVWAK